MAKTSRYFLLIVLLYSGSVFAGCFPILFASSNHTPLPVHAGFFVKLRVSDGGTPLFGVNIKLSHDTMQPVVFSTMAPDGWDNEEPSYLMGLESDRLYTISLSKEGYVPLVLSLDTHLPAGVSPNSMRPAVLDVKMLKLQTHPDLANVDFPIALLIYDAKSGKFVESRKYYNSVKPQLSPGH